MEASPLRWCLKKYSFTFGQDSLNPQIMSLFPSPPKTITRAHQLPENK